MARSSCHTPAPSPLPTTLPLHGLCGNSVHRLAAIKCTCRFVFAVTFIRRSSAFFLQPSAQPSPAQPCHMPHAPTLAQRAYAVWAKKKFALQSGHGDCVLPTLQTSPSRPPLTPPLLRTIWHCIFWKIYLTASSWRRCCGCKSALAAACHSTMEG